MIDYNKNGSLQRPEPNFPTLAKFEMAKQITIFDCNGHGLRTPREEIDFTARPKIQSQSQIFWYGGSIFCLPQRPNFSDIFDLCLHWVSVVHAPTYILLYGN